jgi:uncharacterized protein YndB with AHSA1/START domain
LSDTTNRIEKHIDVRASRSRVWRALTDAREFAHWFGLELDGPIVPATRRTGTFVGSAVDLEVGKAQRAHAGRTFPLLIERVEPERLLSFRWHPGAVDPDTDYSSEPMTLVEFRLDDITGGTRVTIVESGFEAIPLARRAEAFSSNEQGWAIMTGVLAKYVSDSK